MNSIEACFSIGFKCTTDDFMKKCGIRKYSGPFSYMVCDLETALDFIEKRFETFLDVEFIPIENHKFIWNTRFWDHDIFYNKNYLPKEYSTKILETKRICCWNHHNLNDSQILESVHRRIKHFQKAIELGISTLLIYIENLQEYEEDTYERYYNRNLCKEFLERHQSIHICILIPLYNYPHKPTVIQKDNRINIVFYNSYKDGNTNDITDERIEWNTIKKLVNELYKFSIDSRELTEDIKYDNLLNLEF